MHHASSDHADGRGDDACDSSRPDPSDSSRPDGLSRRAYLGTLAAATTGLAATGADTAAAQSVEDVEPSEKRGYAGWVPAEANALGAGWHYNWTPTDDSVWEYDHDNYLPMINGDDLGATGWATNQILEHEYDPDYVLGFNEPEHEEGYTDVETILYPHWETISDAFRDTDVAICSPSIKTGTATGRQYLDEFMSAVESDDNLVVDELAVHWYAGTEAMRDDPGTQAQWFLDQMDSLYEQYGRPIWITEFGGPNFANVDADSLASSNITFLERTVPELEARDYIQGYAWWEGGRATSLTEEVDDELQLTDVGQAYVGLTDGDGTTQLDVPESETVAPGRYQLEAVHSGHVLEVADGSGENGADVQQGADSGATHQQWDLEYEGDGRYRLLAAHSGAAADVVDASDESGANVQQWAANDGEHQRWYVDPVGDDQFRVVAAHSHRVLDVFDEATDPGATVGQYSWNGGDNQRWTLEAVDADSSCAGVQSAESAAVDGQTVCDLDGDGAFRDVTGDGEVAQDDVVHFFENQHRDAWKQPDLFDFSGSDSVGHGDVVALFEHVSL